MSLLGLALTFLAGALAGSIAMSGSTLLTRRREARGPYEELVRTGLARLAASDAAASAAALGRACEVDSSDDAVFLLLAEQLRRAGDADRARHVIDVVLARRDQRPEVASTAWLVRGRLLEDDGRARDALASYATAVEIDPASIEALVARGRLLSAMRRWDDAIACAEELAKLQPERGRRIAARRRILLARERLAEGRADEALELVERAVEDGSEPAAARLTQGDALFQLGRPAPAAQAWMLAARELPATTALVLDRLEQVPGGVDRGERARTFAEESIERPGAGPRDVWRVHAWLAADALRRGQRERARRWLDRLEHAAPRSATAARLRGLFEAGDGRASGTESVLRWDPWRCRRCGEELDEFEWRCPRCRAWASLR